MRMEYEDFHPNLRRKAESEDFPVEKKVRIKNPEQFVRFSMLQNDLEDRTNRYSNQATFEYVLRLAWEKYLELEDKDDEFQELAEDSL